MKNYDPIMVEDGANLMQALMAHGLPVASSCYGDGVCGKCRLEIVAGQEGLSPINDTEMILRDRLKISKNVRISCQTKVHGDLTIDASYW